MSHAYLGVRLLSVFAIIAGFSSFVPAAPLVNQSSAPDTYGYRWIDNQGSDDPAGGGSGPDFTALWQSIATTGASLSINSDDVTTSFECPILIRYYGQNFGTPPSGSSATAISSSVWVSSNGNVQFTGGSASAAYSNTSLPGSGMNGMVALMWDDLYGGGSGNNACWEVVGTEPDRLLIVQWSSWDFCCSDGANMEFQVQFTESDGSGDSSITFLYNTLSSGDSRQLGSSATVGIQSPDQSSYLEYSSNSASLATGRAIRFANNVAPSVPANLHQAGTSGGAARLVGFITDATVYLRATVNDTDASNTVGIEAEILPSATPFSSNPTGTIIRTDSASLVPVGQVAEALLDFAVTGLPSGDYHWRARSFDNAGGTSPWVIFNPAAVHFTTDLLPPTTPGGPYSPDSVQLIYSAPSGDVSFSWGAATDTGPPGPIGYRIEISSDAGFNSIIYDSIVATQAVTVNLVASATSYYWRVSAVDQAGNAGPTTSLLIFQLGWTTTTTKEPDRYSNCGAGNSSSSWGVAAMLAALAGLAAIRIGRRGAA